MKSTMFENPIVKANILAGHDFIHRSQLRSKNDPNLSQVHPRLIACTIWNFALTILYLYLCSCHYEIIKWFLGDIQELL